MLSGLTSKFSTLIGKETVVASGDNGVAGDSQQPGDPAAAASTDVKEQTATDEQTPAAGSET